MPYANSQDTSDTPFFDLYALKWFAGLAWAMKYMAEYNINNSKISIIIKKINNNPIFHWMVRMQKGKEREREKRNTKCWWNDKRERATEERIQNAYCVCIVFKSNVLTGRKTAYNFHWKRKTHSILALANPKPKHTYTHTHTHEHVEKSHSNRFLRHGNI